MKQSNRIFTIFILFALLVVSVGVTAKPAAAAGPYVCLPTCNETDGRMLSLAGIGFETLAGQTISFKIAVPATMSSFEIGIFDGDSGGTWDYGTVPLVYTLYADPFGSGDTSYQVAQWTGSGMADNLWTDLTINQSSLALAPSGDYFYHLHAELPNAANTKTWSNFKIRSNTPVELSANESFAYSVPLFTQAETNILYPQGPWVLGNPSTWELPTTFDGSWDMTFYLPKSTPSFIIWDGDMDYGSFDCSMNDTDDADTPNSIPSWATGISDVAEGVATSTNLCRNSTGTIITGPEGQIYASGNPADDHGSPKFRRSPSVNYTVTDPNNNIYQNNNPSGNREWEQFRIDADPGTPADYHTGGLLPAGVYTVHITGLDISNLNAWHLIYDQVCIHDDGTPCIPVLDPFLIGDTVWNDANGNGIQDAGELGIAGVTVSLLDSNNQILETTVTNSNGNYNFSVVAGTYYVEFTPPSGYNFATKNAAGSTNENDSNANLATGKTDAVVVTNANDLTIDAGLYQPASIGDFVWNDLNGNGIQDAGETGIAGVTVKLLGSDGTTILLTTTTNAVGNYNFTNLFTSVYTVQFSAPASFNFTVKNAPGSTVANDSNANPSTGKTDPFSLAAGATDNTIDAGLKSSINYCGYIRTPGYWKNYKNHMSNATFLSFIGATLDFKTLTIQQVTTILGKNGGVTTGINTDLNGVDAAYLKWLLTSEINAVWNGDDNTPALGGLMGTGTYLGTGMTVNQFLHQAYLDRRAFSTNQFSILNYLGAGGEYKTTSECQVIGFTPNQTSNAGTFAAAASTTENPLTAAAPTNVSETEVPAAPVETVTATPVASAPDPAIGAGQEPAEAVNYCSAIRTSGFWKDYRKSMSKQAFQDLIAHTLDFSNLSTNQVVSILGMDHGTLRGINDDLNGVEAAFLKALLTAELNAAWNGLDKTPSTGDLLGSGTYQGAEMTVNQFLHQAFLDRNGFTTDELNILVYLGSGGKGTSANECLVQP
jgi:hypothetical protein